MDENLTPEELLEKYSNDLSHPYEVRKLSLMMFDELNDKVKNLSSKDRKYLEAAALLHDIGYYVDSVGHNKHSYKLITDSSIEDFTKRDVLITGCICRYHRGKNPDKKKHEGYCDLDKKERKKVKRLSGILRIADGLDRAHMRLIQKLKINFDEENSIVEVILQPNTPDYRPDITYAIKKKDLFEAAFKTQIVFKFA